MTMSKLVDNAEISFMPHLFRRPHAASRGEHKVSAQRTRGFLQNAIIPSGRLFFGLQ